MKEIDRSTFRCCLSITQGCSAAIAPLLLLPKDSNMLINLKVYNVKLEVLEILECLPVAPNLLSRLLAQRAWQDAKMWNQGSTPVFGVALTTTSRSESDEIYYLSVWSQSDFNSTVVTEYQLQVHNNYSNTKLCDWFLRGLAEAANIPIVTSSEIQPTRHRWETNTDPISAVLLGSAKFALFNSKGDIRIEAEPYVAEDYSCDKSTIYLLYPGSFNPLHWGHTELASAAIMASRRLSHNATKSRVILTYEISSVIVDKHAVSENEIRARIKQFTSTQRRVALTTARLFIEKAKIFKNHGFVVGIDTARRILDPRFYQNSEESIIAALQEIENNGCYFLVGGRKDPLSNEWDELSKICIPKCLERMFVEINSADFRVDISSTQLRASKALTN